MRRTGHVYPIKKIEYNKLNTANLLRYYRAERKRFNRVEWCCPCCGEFIWEIYPDNNDKFKKFYYEYLQYLEEIKAELNTREHIQHKHNAKRTKNIRNKRAG